MLGSLFSWFTRRHEDKLRWQTDRTQILYALPADPREYLDPLSRQEVVRRVEWLMEKFGLVKEGIVGTARHTIGTGLTLQHNSSSTEWNAEAEADFMLWSLTPGRCDIAGRRDFYDAQRTAVEQLLLRGEFFAQDVKNRRWEGAPAFQLFDTTEIDTPESLQADPQVYDGVRLGEFNEPIAYYQRYGPNRDQVRELLAPDVTHWFEPTGINQVRGEPALSPAVNKLVDWLDLEKLVVQTAKTQNAIAIAVKKLAKVGGKGAINAVKSVGGATPSASAPATDTGALEKAFPGLVAYLGQDGEAQMIQHTSPNDKLEPFLTNLISPDVFLTLGLPSEFFWSPGKLGGANTRFVLSRADLRFKTLADALIFRWCNRQAYRYTQHRISTGRLSPCPDPNWAEKMTWQQPARVTVDNQRDGKLEIEQLANGVETLRDIYDRRGKGYRGQMTQWLREWQEFLQEAERMKLPDWVVRKWRAGAPGAGAGAGPAPTDPAAAAGGEPAGDPAEPAKDDKETE